MRKLILLTTFSLSGLFTACQSSSLFGGVSDVFSYKTNLTELQQDSVQQINTTFANASDDLLEPQEEAMQEGFGQGQGQGQGQRPHGERQGHGPHDVFHKGFNIDWMISYLEGELDQQDVMDAIATEHAERVAHMEERQTEMLDLLETFTEEQVAQFLDNLDQRQSWLEERQAGRDDDHSPEDRLFGDVNLTETQQAELDALIGDMGQDHMAHFEEERATLEAFLGGEMSREEVEAEFTANVEQKLLDRQAKAADWIAFLDGLEQVQQDVLVANLEELQTRMEEHQAEREERLGDRPEEGTELQ